MNWCECCHEENHLDSDAHPCCARYWTGTHCPSCEASKRHHRENTRPRRRTA